MPDAVLDRCPWVGVGPDCAANASAFVRCVRIRRQFRPPERAIRQKRARLRRGAVPFRDSAGAVRRGHPLPPNPPESGATSRADSAVSCTRFEGREAICLGESHGLGRQRAVRGRGERGSRVCGPHRTGHRWQVVDLTLPAVLGAIGGLLVGFAAVVGGKYALKTAVPWPPSGRKQWRHRFSLCTAAVVTLFVAGLSAWASAASGMVASDSAEPPIQLMVTIALTAISYVFAYFLAPEVN